MIEIQTEKLVVLGVASRKIVAVAGIRATREFPNEYTKTEPYISKCGGEPGGIAVFGGNDMALGVVIPEPEFQRMLEHIRQAAARAHEIMERARALVATWKGTETFVI